MKEMKGKCVHSVLFISHFFLRRLKLSAMSVVRVEFMKESLFITITLLTRLILNIFCIIFKHLVCGFNLTVYVSRKKKYVKNIM